MAAAPDDARRDGAKATAAEIDRCRGRFGNIYALVHVRAARAPSARDIEDFQLKEWAHVIDLNLDERLLAARAWCR